MDKNFEILKNEFTKINTTHEDTIKNLDNLYLKLNSFEHIANQASNFSNNSSSVSTFQQNIKFIKSEITQILENFKQKNSTKNNNLRKSNSNLNNNENFSNSRNSSNINSNNLLINPHNNNSENNNNNMIIGNNNNNSSGGFYSNNFYGNLALNNDENLIANMANNRNKTWDTTNNLITQINNNYNNFKEKRNKSLKKFNVTNNDPSPLMYLKNNSLNKSAAQLNINISSENLKNTNNLLKAYKFENIANLKNTPSANISCNSANPPMQNTLLYNQSSNIKSYPNSGANSNNSSFIYQNANMNLI